MTQTHDEAVRPRQGASGGVPVDEPAQPDRIRRSSDGIRFAASVVGLAVVMLLVSFAQGTTHGLHSDIQEGTAHAPRLLLSLATLVSSFGVLAVPIAFGIERLFHRDGTRVAIALLAAVIALGITIGLDNLVVRAAPRRRARLADLGRHGHRPDPHRHRARDRVRQRGRDGGPRPVAGRDLDDDRAGGADGAHRRLHLRSPRSRPPTSSGARSATAPCTRSGRRTRAPAARRSSRRWSGSGCARRGPRGWTPRPTGPRRPAGTASSWPPAQGPFHPTPGTPPRAGRTAPRRARRGPAGAANGTWRSASWTATSRRRACCPGSGGCCGCAPPRPGGRCGRCAGRWSRSR